MLAIISRLTLLVQVANSLLQNVNYCAQTNMLFIKDAYFMTTHHIYKPGFTLSFSQ